ncbi:hypothetical protein LCGC14_0337860 [marine sediment metagenome]|uniref:Uncharacterized protein n=1 Tax=marine sediment metagenome TaxID=412755 RepID=A0A0F9TXA2_9ZZZZ
MSREKAAALMALSDVDMAVYRSKRNQRPYWQRLSRDEWVEFCEKMAMWFSKEAPDEWDNYVIANNARKAASDKAALERRNG